MSEASAHAVHHGPPTSFIRKYVFSLDHKVIGKQYYALALVAVFTGMALSWLMRIHLVWPNAPIPGLGCSPKLARPAA
jgi:cytochrome c oxidase subunit I